MMNGKRSILALAAWLFGASIVFAADGLNWNSSADTVTAVVETWTVPQMLQRVAGATGWKVFVDPGITNRIPARFVEKPPGDALRKLLGHYNYALVPETNGPSRLFVFRDSRSQATQAITPVDEAVAKKSKSLIANELIVTLKPGEKIEDIAKRLGAKIVGRSDEQNTYRLRFDDDKAAQVARTDLEKDPSVDSIDNNYYVNRTEPVQPLGSAGTSLGLNPKVTPDGKYTVVGLIDSAVQAKQGNFEQFILSGSGDGSAAGNEPTHGTSMAETILRGVAALSEDKSSAVRIAPANAFPDNGATTTTYDIAVAIYNAAKNGPTVFNISAGSDADSSFLHKTIQNVAAQGPIFVAAAGNTPVTTPTYPAAYPEVIAVTATDRTGNLASYANRGDFVDAAAPGGSIVTFNGQQYYVVGTSASTAYVSGLAAALAESKNLSGAELRAALLQLLSTKTATSSAK